jgi:hypothetical protein
MRSHSKGCNESGIVIVSRLQLSRIIPSKTEISLRSVNGYLTSAEKVEKKKYWLSY